MSGIYDEFGGSLTADVLIFNPDAIPAPDTLVIRMTRGKRRIADELRKEFGGFKRVVIDVDGERHEFGADSLICMLEDYEDAQGMNNYMKLFGTPEKAVQTIAAIGGQYPCDEGAQDCDTCPLNGAPCRLNRGKPEESKLLEWLRGDA